MSARCHPADLVLCGVELDVDDAGEDVVRDREGVLVRESGRRKDMFRSLSKGEACHCISFRALPFASKDQDIPGAPSVD